jgi:Tol biopolymer transport system component
VVLTPDRWQQIQSVFHAALEQDPDARAAFVATACTGDPELRAEVESLLRQSSSDLNVPPRRIGDYDVLEPIGYGGTGIVYRGRDPKLARDVAIKLLSSSFAGDSEHLARLHREALVLASLNHPNIAAIYGVQEGLGTIALVLEFVPGETLASRIARGAIPLGEALTIARQIADALGAAHEQGIVHRDLKPANIKITPDGIVKVLDFGLARSDQPIAATSVSPLNVTSPSPPLLVTGAGTFLGTAPYMSPEQVRGRKVDKRADIWAFGAVVYEMVTGHRPFDADDLAGTMAKVLEGEPRWDDVPLRLQRLLKRCLEKDEKKRLHDIADVWDLLDAAPDVVSSTATGATASARTRQAWLPASIAILAILLAVYGVYRLMTMLRSVVAEAPARVAFQIRLPASADGAVVSPDGTKLVFVPGTPVGNKAAGLFVRALDSLDLIEERLVPGTEGAIGRPFWSPDSRYIGFTSTDGKLKKLDVTSGTVQELCNATVARGGFWTRDGTIVFSDDGILTQVPMNDGRPSPLSVSLDPDARALGPVLLPDGRHFLFYQRFVAPGIYIAALGDAATKPKKLMDGMLADFVRSSITKNVGYVLLLRGVQALGPSNTVYGTLVAQGFDLHRLQPAGEQSFIRDRVGLASASQTGIIVFAPAPTGGDRLTIFDRQGNALQTIGDSDQYGRMSFSPADKTSVIAARGNELWMFDLMNGSASRFPRDAVGAAGFPVWSPDASRILFLSDHGGKKRDLYTRLSKGGGHDERLFTPEGDVNPLSWSGNGAFIAIGANDPKKGENFVITLDSKGNADPNAKPLGTKGMGIDIQFSPEKSGPPRWFAYQSTNSRPNEIYLREFDPNAPGLTPAEAGDYPVSNGGGTSPRWNPNNAKELFYLSPNRTVMSVEITDDVNHPIGRTTRLFQPVGLERASSSGIATLNWAVSPDGEQFLFPIPVAPEATATLNVVVNSMSLLNGDQPR